MPFQATVDITYIKNNNGVAYVGELDDDVMNAVLEHARNHLQQQHPDLNVVGISYEAGDPDQLVDITSDNNPNEEIQIPELSIQSGGDTYLATFGLLEFTEQNQNGGKRRHKSRSRRAKKTARRRVQRKHNLKRKTHRSKRKLHRK